MPQNVCYEAICRLSEKCLKSVLEHFGSLAVGNYKCLSISSAFQGSIDGTSIVADQQILLNNSLFSHIPIEVTWNHFVLDVVALLLFRRVLDCLIPSAMA